MTESEWLAATDPTPMLAALQAAGKASDRKLRLFAVASCRDRYGKYFQAGDPGQGAIELAERYADGLARREEVEATKQGATEYGYQFLDALFGYTEAYGAYMAAAGLLERSNSGLAGHTFFPSDCAEMRAGHVALLRDVFGPLPFRGVTIPSSIRTWNDGIVIRLAQAAYEQRSLPPGTLEPEQLAVLADALEEAGCQDQEVLTHLRQQQAHWRGCWVLDLLLKKG
jgi:hypothetical protein